MHTIALIRETKPDNTPLHSYKANYSYYRQISVLLQLFVLFVAYCLEIKIFIYHYYDENDDGQDIDVFKTM